MRRVTIPAVVIVVGLLILVDLLIVNDSLTSVTTVVIDAAIVVAAGAALAAGGSLGLRRARDLWERRGDPIGAAAVLLGMALVLVAGLRPGASGVTDPAVGWLVVALMVPIGATLFALLFWTTLAAMRRSLRHRGREAVVMAIAAVVVLILLLPIGGPAGEPMSSAASWILAVPIGAVFRGMLVGIAILAAVLAARTLLGVGTNDE
ncbi:MAG TPA: hypothetical protein VI277_00765 [Candidatus Limnocylindria bacterium]